MSLEKAGFLRQLRQDGATIDDLARAFGCAYSTAEKIIHNRQWVYRPCLTCWRPLDGSRREDTYCEQCVRQRCSHCDGPKDPHRRAKRCVTCDRENHRNCVARAHHCRWCGEEMPEDRRNTLCRECANEEAAFKKRFRDNAGKTCKNPGCDNPLPLVPTWSRAICRECAKRNDTLRVRLRRRFCSLCDKERKDEDKGSLCPACRHVDRKMRKRGATVTPEEHVQYREQEHSREKKRASRAQHAG